MNCGDKVPSSYSDARRSAQPFGDMSAEAIQSRTQRRLLVAGAVVLPVAVMALHVIASRAPFQRFPVWSYYLALRVALVSGAFFVWKLVPQAGWRTLALLVYALGCTGFLLMFSLIFTCAAFGDCL